MNSDTQLTLDEAVKSELESWLRSTTIRSGLALRASIVLASAEGLTPTEISHQLNVSRRIVYKWVKRFIDEGIEGLNDKSRPGRPKVIEAKTVKHVLEMTTQQVPKEATHWSIKLMAKYANITTWQVRQIWKSAGLKPHIIHGFKISNDPNFADKVIDIVGLYMNPPDNALVLSVDEKTQIQALERTQEPLPMSTGHPESRTHDYKRHGTTSLFAAFNILTGRVIGKLSERTRSKDFLSFLKHINRLTPKDKHLHIILDNLSAHKTQAINQWLSENKRVHFHFTPTSSSWLNAVEGWFSQLERRMLYRGVFTSVQELKDAIEKFIKVHNEELAKPFKWTKSAEAILDAVERAKQVLPN